MHTKSVLSQSNPCLLVILGMFGDDDSVVGDRGGAGGVDEEGGGGGQGFCPWASNAKVTTPNDGIQQIVTKPCKLIAEKLMCSIVAQNI